MKTKTMRTALGLLAGAVAAGGAVAQQGQTAEGAQRFLAALAKKGSGHAWLVDAQGRTNHVSGKSVETIVEIGLLSDDEHKVERTAEKQLSSFTATELDSLGREGQPDACMTRIARWAPRQPLFESQSWTSTDEGVFVDTEYRHTRATTYELTPALSSPQWIDWRDVTLARTTDSRQMTVSSKAKQHTVFLAFTGDIDLIDRVEYAMKFLKMSCDETAATGF